MATSTKRYLETEELSCISLASLLKSTVVKDLNLFSPTSPSKAILNILRGGGIILTKLARAVGKSVF